MESITKTIVLDTETVKVPRLNLEDLFGLCEELTAHREKDAESLGKAEKLDKLDVANMKLDLRMKKVSVAELLSLCSTPQIASKVIRSAMSKGKIASEAQGKVMEILAIPQALELARMLVLDEQDAPEEAKTESPLPTAEPVTSGSSASGQAKEEQYYGAK